MVADPGADLSPDLGHLASDRPHVTKEARGNTWFQ
jgi:hypothetical protein